MMHMSWSQCHQDPMLFTPIVEVPKALLRDACSECFSVCQWTATLKARPQRTVRLMVYYNEQQGSSWVHFRILSVHPPKHHPGRKGPLPQSRIPAGAACRWRVTTRGVPCKALNQNSGGAIHFKLITAGSFVINTVPIRGIRK